jgi:hypothetical protein
LKNEAVQLSIFGIVPSITYNFKFWWKNLF